jgi:hypothetical protein
MDHNLNISLERTKSVTFFYNKVRNKNTPHKYLRNNDTFSYMLSSRYEKKANLLSLFFSTPHFYSLLLFSCIFFSFVCRCSSTRSTILASLLCIRLSASVLYCSYPPWPLLLFTSCVFALNKSFILYEFALIDDL